MKSVISTLANRAHNETESVPTDHSAMIDSEAETIIVPETTEESDILIPSVWKASPACDIVILEHFNVLAILLLTFAAFD